MVPVSASGSRRRASSASSDGSFPTDSALKTAILRGLEGERGHLPAPELGDAVLAFEPLQNAAWVAIAKMDRGELFATLRQEIARLVGIATLLTLGGVAGIIAILRPLAGKVIVHTDELESEIERKTSDLEEANKGLGPFFRVALDMLCIAGTDGYFKRINPAFSSTLGYPEEELLEKPFLEFVHPADRPATKEAVARLAGGTPVVSFENRYRHRNGGYRWIEWNAAPDDGKLVLSPQPFSLRDSLGDTLQTLAVTAEKKGLELAYDIPSEVPDRLVADLGRLRQVLRNLVGNAIKFTREGEVLVTVNLVEEKVGSALLEFTVQDTGIGISAEKQRQIFEAFTQADASTTRDYGGTGLGLAISQEIVSLMDGSLTVESEPGEGSTFRFTVPLGVEKSGDEDASLLPSLDQLPVLVVDDNDTNRRILVDMLAAWSVRPTGARNGQEALAEIQRAAADGVPYRVILLDFMMPGIDGIDLAHRIRALPLQPPPKLFLLSSAGPQLLDSGEVVDQSLCKPVKPSDLLDTIVSALGVARLDSPPDLRDTNADPSLPPLRILVVEDNRVNQNVAARFLERRGHHARIVDNGRKALEALEEDPSFDLVLMDVQMPVMNGYEATRAIREQEAGAERHLPIVAMTAHAMTGDREKCFAVGMDGYVTKPLRAQELDQALAETLASLDAIPAPGAEAKAAPRRENEPPATASEPGSSRTFDPEAFTTRTGSQDLMIDLIDVFDEETSGQLAKLREGFATSDPEPVQEAAHNLKGMLGNYAAPEAESLATRLERAAGARDLRRAESCFEGLSAAIARLGSRLREFRDTLEDGRPPN